MRYLILSAVCLCTFLPPVFAQNPTSTSERRTIILDVLLIDLKNQSAEEIETLVKDRARFNKTLADGKIKMVSSMRTRSLTGEVNNLRIGQRLPTNSSQAQYENTSFNLSLTLNLTAEKMIEVKYAIEWSATITNFQVATPTFIQRSLMGLTKLSPNELTPVIDLIQREPLWKSATPTGQEKPDESTGNFLVLFLGKVAE